VPPHRLLWCAALLAAIIPVGSTTALAQGGIELTYEQWWHSTSGSVYGVAYHDRLLGPFSWSLGGYHLDDHRSPLDRTQTGAAATLALGRDGSGLYALAGAALGVRHADGNFDASWEVGTGWSVRFLSVFALALQVGYRWEDEGVRGFWRLEPADRHGFEIGGRFAIGRAPTRGRPRPSTGPAFAPPTREEIERAAAAPGTSSESADLAVQVVESALGAMGSPYEWGGDDTNGYDCSGLIQWAYGEHGILLPRMSADQARMGTLIPKDVDALRPGDILGFAVNGSGVSHVGLYVGDGRFIHSASTGVRLSSLSASDSESRYWRARWVSARRILN
jgi:cell wall-associated NlpC family hydrolase